MSGPWSLSIVAPYAITLALIGQSMINVRSGGRSRLSTLSAGLFLLIMILVFGDLVAMIPMAGVVLAAIFFARRVAHLVEVTSVLDPDGGERVYALTGELFFASSNEPVHSFDYDDDVQRVVIDLTGRLANGH